LKRDSQSLMRMKTYISEMGTYTVE
jgi:hypothetical protein